MNTYIAFYRSKKIEVQADTALVARDIAVKIFKARKSYDVTVVLAEKNGEVVVHSTTEFG